MFVQQGMIRRPLEQAEEVAGHTNSQKRKLFEINNFNGNMRFFAVFGGITNLVFRLGATACSSIPKGLTPSAQRWPDSERAYAGWL
jgi:hypothetical protein